MTAVNVEAVRDARAFAVLAERHRRELHRHCQRILHSRERAEDAVQEALLRAWRAREEFAGRATARSWLHRIATNACLDEVRRAAARGPATLPLDDDADPSAPAACTPEAVLEAGDALERAWLVVMELLPPRQRAVLVLRGVLELPAAETARLLGTTAAAVNSALQRARATLAAGWPGPEAQPHPAEPAQLDAYVVALRRQDAAAIVAVALVDVAGAADRPAA